MEQVEKTLLLEKRVSILEEQVHQLQIKVAELDPNQASQFSIEEEKESASCPMIEEDPVVRTETADSIEEAAVTTESEEAIAPIEEAEVPTEEENINAEVEMVEEVKATIEEAEVMIEEEAEVVTEGKKEEPSKEVLHTEPQVSPIQQHSSLESKIGKKLIPIAGSALILIALILFGSLIRPHLTDEVKAIIMAALSLGISAFGLLKMKPENKYHTFFSALAGCGVSACYITALVAHFSLEVLSETTLMAVISIWIIALILLSKFKSKMFTYICYIGILIAAAMTIQRWNDSPIGLITYLLSIAALFAANFSKEYKKVLWYIIQLPVVLFFMSIAYWGDKAPQIIIFGATLVALIGQTAYYKRLSDTTRGFAIPTLLSIPTLYMSGFMIDNSVACSLIIAATMTGICIYHYRIFVQLSKNEEAAFWIPFAFSAIGLPFSDYGEFYSHYFGFFLVPAIIMIVLNALTSKKIFLYIGLAYSFLFTIFYPKAYGSETAEGTTFNYGCWIFAAILGCIYAWAKHISDKPTRILALLGGFWFIIQLCYCSWTGMLLTYMLMVLYCVMLNFRPFKMEAYKAYTDSLDVATLTVIISGLFVRTDDFLSISDSSLVEIPYSIGLPLCSAATAMLLWSWGYFKQNKGTIHISYLLLPCLFFTLGTKSNQTLALILYIAIFAAMAYNVVRHYSANEKLLLAILGITLPWLPYCYDMISFTECWILCAIYSITLFLTHFFKNPETGEEEQHVHRFCLIFNGITLFIGAFLLRYDKGPLFIGHILEGTESIVTVLLILLSMTLAAADVSYLYRRTNANKERSVSIYQGLKFTILFWVILCRFASVSYVNSIIGIILAVIFVSVGFRFKYKGLRLYGLCLSMLCVIKLIFFDIIFDNAFYRAGSFLVAGLLLFLISFIYFRLEKKNGEIGQDNNQTQE